jgi:glycosyltransferase involved in cell wall biosynthesis
MKFALVIYGSLSTPSGGYLYDRKLVDYLERQGDRVEILSLPWRNYARHLGDNFSTGLRKRLQELRVDVLLQDELNHPSLFLMNDFGRGQIHAPIVSIVHHLRSSEARPAWQNRLYRGIERRYLASVDGFIFNSRTTCSVVQGLLGRAPLRPWTVAYPAGNRLQTHIIETEIERRARDADRLRLVFLGNLIPRKNLHILLEAVRRLPEGGWILSVAGSADTDPGYAVEIRRQAARAGLENHLNFLGHLGEEDLAALLRSSHALVVPSSYEGFVIAYLEGMGFGLPAIASTAGAAGEIITPGENGFLVEPGNADSLAACLSSILHDRSRLARMGKAALKRFGQHPTWDQSAAQIRLFLQSLLA